MPKDDTATEGYRSKSLVTPGFSPRPFGLQEILHRAIHKIAKALLRCCPQWCLVLSSLRHASCGLFALNSEGWMRLPKAAR